MRTLPIGFTDRFVSVGKIDRFCNHLLKVWFSRHFTLHRKNGGNFLKNTHHFSPWICIGWKRKELNFFATISSTFLTFTIPDKTQNKENVFSFRKTTHRPVFFFDSRCCFWNASWPTSSSSHRRRNSLTGPTSHSYSPIWYVFLCFTFWVVKKPYNRCLDFIVLINGRSAASAFN